ncbi:MAG: T9SS type A sorting domain-containing protein [Bacteroidales bacterium]|nr:T9SS type A sorting domain-containing protein [Bacteroidales bacterium]
MKKIYPLILATMFCTQLFAQKSILFVSANAPDADATIQKFIEQIESIEGFSVTHKLLADYKLMTAAEFGAFDAAVLSENGGSADYVTIGNEGWPIAVLNLKSYMNHRPTSPLYAAQADVDWFLHRTYDIAAGALTMYVENNNDILCNYTEGSELVWSTGTDGTPSITDAHCQTFNLEKSTVTDVAGNAILLGSIKELKDGGENTSAFLWKINENNTTKRTVLWGIHHGFIGEGNATADFWKVIKNSIVWLTGGSPCSSTALKPVLEETNDITVFCSSISKYASVNFKLNVPQTSNIQVMDISGKIVYSQLLNGNAGSNEISFSTNSFACGLYIVKLSAGHQILTEKFIVR